MTLDLNRSSLPTRYWWLDQFGFLVYRSRFMGEEKAGCVFCCRDVRTRGHHLIPKSKGGIIIVPTCHDCEDFIHRNFTHTQLRDDYNTVEKMQATEGYQRFVAWLRRQQSTASFSSKRSRTRDTKKAR